jgi:hypothetical protein
MLLAMAVGAAVLAPAGAVGVGPAAARPASGNAASVSTVCARGGVAVSAAQWAAAQKGFANAFGRIRTYLLNPTLANQSRMYARVDASLFQFYSYAGGQLNENRGKAKGGFSWTFVAGTHCYDTATKTVSFQVHLRAKFTSRNKQTLKVADLAHVEMKPPRITRYDRLPGH